MDLMILIIILLGAFLLYYLIEIIRSLSQEIKEIKTKCIKGSDNSDKDNSDNSDNSDKDNLDNSDNSDKDNLDNYKNNNNEIKFKTDTIDPIIGINKMIINNMNYLKNYFDINK